MNRRHLSRGLTPLGSLPAAMVLLVILIAVPQHATDGWAADVTVTLKAAVEIESDAIRLGDIALLEQDTEDRVRDLGETVVGQAPLPGQTRFVDADYIRIRLRQAGYATDRILFRGADDVRVTRKAATLPAARIREAVETAIRNRMPWRSEGVTISNIRFDESLPLPTGRLSYCIVPNRNEDYLGQILIALHLFVDGEPFRKIWVNADISVMADVVVVSRPLGRNQPVETPHITVERRDLAHLPSDAIRRVDDVVGNRTTRMLYPGTVMQASMIALPPLVKRGDIVKIVAVSGPMTISATGMVKQQGAKGDLVRVVNTGSNRMITARVTGPGVVAVDF